MSNPKEFKTTFCTYYTKSTIGGGGSGRIILVNDDDNNEYALKLLDPNRITTNKLKRFKNELYFCLHNTHPNIVSVIDHGVITTGSHDSPFYLMKYYKQSLRDMMKDGIQKSKVLEYFVQILDGIEAAHLKKVFHRDIKPENILFDDEDDTLLIADFGIAHFEEEDLFTSIETRDQERLANFQYAAPEQRTRGAKVDARADIFALGLLLNEMYTGVVPAGTEYMTIGELDKEHSFCDSIVENMIKQKSTQRYESIEKIKWELLSHETLHVNMQRLEKTKNEVVKDPEVDDPLVSDPVLLTGFDWDNGVLTLMLNRTITKKWIQSLLNMSRHTSLLGHGPEMFNFAGDKATIGAREEDVQSIIDHFKDWLPNANQVYANVVYEAARQEKEKQIKELKKRREQQEARQRVLNNTKI